MPWKYFLVTQFDGMDDLLFDTQIGYVSVDLSDATLIELFIANGVSSASRIVLFWVVQKKYLQIFNA